jgi:16S rRNA G966 N2-methylase RsmD
MGMREATQLDLFDKDLDEDSGIIPAERHPKRYESHKYWGRKPFNIVRKYISEYSKEGNLILDPFCGSGVTIFEALSLNRNVIGYDLNPIACFITENLIQRDVDTLSLRHVGNNIINELEGKFPYYDVICECGNIGKLICGIWEKDIYAAKYYHCSQCGNKMLPTNDFDERNVADFQFPDHLWYPKDKLPDNADEEYVYQLFTKRNLLASSLLLDEIKKVRDRTIRDLLLYTFTSNVAFTSRIIPVNKKRFEQKRNCTGIWGFKRFWVPDFHVENNVFRYFRNRLKRTVAAKNETNQLLRNSNAFGKAVNSSSEKLRELRDKSVDFIFTDPPFGNMVPYLNLSTLWNSWLQFEVNSGSEIIIDNRHSESDYYNKLLSVLKECYRVLKDGRHLVIAFNNKSIKTWCILLEAIHNSGFLMKGCVPAEDGEVSFTQTTKSAKGSLRGHFVYVFKKTATAADNTSVLETPKIGEVKARIENEILNFASSKCRSITEIYNHIIPFMANNRLLNKHLKNDMIERMLREKCRLVTKTQNRIIEGELAELKSYFWELKHND